MTKRPKRFSTLRALIVLLAVLLTACSQSFFTGQSNYQKQSQEKLLIWHPFEGERAKLVTEGFQEFQHLNPTVDIVSEYVPQRSAGESSGVNRVEQAQNELSSRFIKQTKNGLGASLIIDSARQIPELVKARSIQPIDEKAINLSAYFAPTLPQIRYQGKIYGVPLGSGIRVLCYNSAKVGQSSLAGGKSLSQPPAGLEGLIERAQKGYSVGMVSAFEDTFWGMGLFESQFFDDRGLVKPQLKGWANWLEWLKQASTQPNFILLRDREILHNAFAQGQLTYYVCDSTEIGDLRNDLKDNLRVAFLPREPNRKATPLLYTSVMMLNRSADPNETRLAIELAQFLTNPEQQLQAIVQSQSFIPTRQSVGIDRQLLPIEAVLLEQAKTAVAIPADDLERIIAVFEQGEILYQKTLAGDITPSEAALQLTEVVKTQIDQKTGK